MHRFLLLALISSCCWSADWITDLGGTYQKDARGQIVEVDLTLTLATDDDLAKLAAMPGLTRITLSHTRISDLGLAHLRPLRNVTYLNCYYCDYITDTGVAYLRNWDKIETLTLRGTEITSRVFEHLANMKRLTKLDVSFSRVNDDGWDALSSLESIQELRIGGNKMSGLSLPLLRLLPALKQLDVNGSQRTDSGRWGLMLTDINLEGITALTGLEKLNIGGSAVTDAGMPLLAAMVNLQELDLSRMDLTAKGIEPVAKLPKLRRLNLWQSTRIDDKAVSLIAANRSIELLDLAETSVTDAGLEPLAAMKQLKKVFLDGSKATPAGIEKLRRTRPDLKVIFGPKFKEVTSEEDTRLTG